MTKTEIKVPSLGESITSATISKILKPTGSLVKRDEELLELETEKVNQALYAPADGILNWTIISEQKVSIGETIGWIEATLTAQPTIQAVKPPPPPPPPQAKAAPATTHRKKMSGMRRAIAEKLVSAKNQTAMLTTFNEIDMTHVLTIRSQEKENFQKKHGVKLGFMSFFIKAVVAALKEIPEINSYIDGEDIVEVTSYDIGVAVSTDRGLIVPVIRGCDQCNFAKIETELELLAKKGREGNITLSELSGGSFTITNGGVFGSLLSTPILNPPQSAILGMHAIVKRPIAMNDEVVIRPMMYVALSYDHRIVDGKEAVLFLVHLKQALEDPSRLLLDL